MQPYNKAQIEIDIRDLILFLLNKLWVIILVGIVCALCTGLFSKLVMTPIYTSGTKLYVISREDKETTTYSDIQTGIQLTKDYNELIMSRSVTEKVISDLGLEMSIKQLVSLITINTPTDTRIIEIEVENTDPLIAKQIADAIAEVSAERMVSIMKMEKANIVESGNVPTDPSSPNVLINMIIGGLIGVFIAAFIIFIVFVMDDSIKNVDDIEKYLGLIMLSAIPFESSSDYSKEIKKKKKHKKGIHQEESCDNQINSYEKSILNFYCNEAYKTLRTNIRFCGKEIKTLCITSCTPDEGKTVVAFHLAASLAEYGKKVLFIDADLRKSVIIGRLKIDKAVVGLSQYLSGINHLEEVIYRTRFENIDIIFSGLIPSNPSELIGSDIFKELIKSQREIYDYIIVDTPPLGIVIDSANVAEFCDGTIMIVEADHINYKFAQRVLKQLEKGECNVIGAVLNKVNSHKGYYKKYYGKHYKKEFNKYYKDYEY